MSVRAVLAHFCMRVMSCCAAVPWTSPSACPRPSLRPAPNCAPLPDLCAALHNAGRAAAPLPLLCRKDFTCSHSMHPMMPSMHPRIPSQTDAWSAGAAAAAPAADAARRRRPRAARAAGAAPRRHRARRRRAERVRSTVPRGASTEPRSLLGGAAHVNGAVS